MIPEFNDLGHQEIELLHKAPIWVCILIAGADDKIDKNEVRRAIELTSKNLKATNSRLLPFYDEVGEDFEDKLRIVLQELPRKEKDRSKLIIEQLGKLNTIFKRINRDFNIDFYNSLREIASEVAQSSGGVLGIRKVGEKEAMYITLDMIKNPASS